MNRKTKRSLLRNENRLTKTIKNRVIKKLKDHKIDFIIYDDRIVSTRNKDVENIYNQTTAEVLFAFEKADGNMKLLPKFLSNV